MDLLLNKETNDDTHGFTGGIGSPRFASIIYDCLELQFGVQKLFFSKKKKLESKVNEIYKFSFSSEGTPIKGTRQVEDVYESIKLITENLTKTENKREKK